MNWFSNQWWSCGPPFLVHCYLVIPMNFRQSDQQNHKFSSCHRTTAQLIRRFRRAECNFVIIDLHEVIQNLNISKRTVWPLGQNKLCDCRSYRLQSVPQQNRINFAKLIYLPADDCCVRCTMCLLISLELKLLEIISKNFMLWNSYLFNSWAPLESLAFI